MSSWERFSLAEEAASCAGAEGMGLGSGRLKPASPHSALRSAWESPATASSAAGWASPPPFPASPSSPHSASRSAWDMPACCAGSFFAAEGSFGAFSDREPHSASRSAWDIESAIHSFREVVVSGALPRPSYGDIPRRNNDRPLPERLNKSTSYLLKETRATGCPVSRWLTKER
jgi:hypothetical protein